MKQRQFIKHLTANGCFLFKEGANHTLYKNPENNKMSTVPRHPKIDDNLASLICKQLEIPQCKKS